ncbi:DUF4059 family protein [Streptococcus sp. P25B114]|uniref:DUF4059 family protein n=1 Tax=Streptococcus suis TaxID=1307 RepID=A0A426TDP0_STRSU|nr:DUF4059 family protein [Streptococcus suis]MDW8743447.1 DUF4059 family protein [Streptococcus suis]NJW39252.1 DUF4059 family protein [Streptococcus suis]NQG18935.1 DUF4059 family protein [Streptococcus suis]NQH34363.1 DUF4059 family protein [Streptococcus suis]NQH95672.1 DUF4059 family protein [Streptococcus suis]
MLQSILSNYLQGLLIATIIVVLLSLIWFLIRALKNRDKTYQERQEFLYDLLLINIMTIPILAFGIVAILLMLKA